MKTNQCSLNAIYITSHYLESITDLINLEKVTKRFRGNLEKFTFNPVSLTKHNRSYFPNVQIQHIYSQNDEIFCDGNINQYVIWFPIDYNHSLQLKSKIKKEHQVEFKQLFYSQKDFQQLIDIVKNQMKKKLTKITIPDGIKEIEKKCFSYCTTLRHVSLCSNITSIGRNCFEHCTSLTSISFSEKMLTIPSQCFCNCISLKIISLPSSIQSIGKESFCGCKALETIIIPISVTKLDDGCFERCISLKIIDLPTNVQIIGKKCFYECKSLEKITLPKSIISIGCCAFQQCTQLTELHLHDRIDAIENDHCPYCKAYKHETNETISIFERCFNFSVPLQSLTLEITKDMIQFGKRIYKIQNGKMKRYKIPNCVQLINGKTVTEPTTIIIPTEITTLQNDCFDYLSLKQIKLPPNIKEIGNTCFAYCSLLQSLSIPSSIQYISPDYLLGCNSLTSLSIDITVFVSEISVLSITEKIVEYSLIRISTSI